MMSEVIVDSSALIAFFVKSEKHHLTAQEFVQTHPHTPWIILDTVFSETVTWVRIKISIPHSIQIGQLLRQEHRYIQLSPEDDNATWDIFQRYQDKQWSYTDCSILAMSQRLRVSEVFAFDEHIRQMAGLNVVCVP